MPRIFLIIVLSIEIQRRSVSCAKTQLNTSKIVSEDIELIEYLNETERCQRIQNHSLDILKKISSESAAVIEKWEAVLVMVITGLFALMVACAFSFVRKYVYRDVDSLDTVFDAGGNVNAGITATTVISQWTWTSTILQSCTVTAKYGLCGSICYSIGASIQVLLFSLLSVQLKIRAPGAKTFLQVIKARFGKETHIVFCFVALITNIVITCMLMLGGGATIQALVRDISLEYAIILLSAIIGGYTFIGGLGATFYVSYFNTAVLYVLILLFMFTVYDEDYNPRFMSVGSISNVYDYVSCVKGPDFNLDNSYLTMLSGQGLMFGFITIVGNFGAILADQSFWQSSVAAKPMQGAVGFLTGGVAWIAIPLTMSSAMGFAYLALSAEQGAGLLNTQDINAGLVAPKVATLLLGKTGAMLILIMLVMAITSTGSAEVMAVTSIVIYDIYAVYIRPYRSTTDANSCILCGKGRGRKACFKDKCECVSFRYCANCRIDSVRNRDKRRRAVLPRYRCPTHGSYRKYRSYLFKLKSWAVIGSAMGIIPVTLTLEGSNMSLGWVYMFVGTLCGSSVLPIALCMFWEKLTPKAMISGSVGGALLAVASWLYAASKEEGGLGNFIENTGKETVMLTGNLVAIVGGGLITVIVAVTESLLKLNLDMGGEIWEWTRDIDNPLQPWTEKYIIELCVTDLSHLDNRPSLAHTKKTFAYTQIFTDATFALLLIIILFVWPTALAALGVLDSREFTGWIIICQVWAIVSSLFVIIVPFANEAWDIWFILKHQAGRPTFSIPSIALIYVRERNQTLSRASHSHSNIKNSVRYTGDSAELKMSVPSTSQRSQKSEKSEKSRPHATSIVDRKQIQWQ